MDNKLVIRELAEVASVPNGFDEKVLLQIQENLAMDVLRIHKRDFAALVARQQGDRARSPAETEVERRQFFAQKLQAEYRNRAQNGQGFSLPLYIEAAENYYRLEIGRHLQLVQDYITQGKLVAETYQVQSAYQIRSVDAGMRDIAHRVADGLNALTDSLDRLGRVKSQAAKAVTDKLRTEMANTIGRLHGDRFAQALLTEAATLADAKRNLADLEKGVPQYSAARP